jgi:hypothetical protein
MVGTVGPPVAWNAKEPSPNFQRKSTHDGLQKGVGDVAFQDRLVADCRSPALE